MVFKRTKMTLREVLTKVNTEKPNAFSDEYLTKVVNEVEALVYDYLETPDVDRIFHVLPDDIDVELNIPDPYSAAYESYLKARLDYANEEYELYSNNQAQFNADFDAWKAFAMRHGQVDTSNLPTQIKNWW